MNICFVALPIYPVIKPNSGIPYIGGAELQQKYIGEELSKLGHHVSYIVFDHGQSDEEIINGFVAYKAFNPKRGTTGLRFFHPRLSGLWKALKRANADIYYCRCASWQVGVVAYFAKRFSKKCVFAGANAPNFYPFAKLNMNMRDKYLYRYGLKNADLVICQSPTQVRMLQQNYGIEGHMIPNIFPPLDRKRMEDADKFVWISYIRDFKRPLMFLELAERVPECEFVIVGDQAPGEKSLYRKVIERANRLDNMKFLGFQSFEEVEELLDETLASVNTSAYEGFPNTYLQAWRRGIPVITTFDPDLDIEHRNLGFVVGSIEDLAEKVRLLSNMKSIFDEKEIQNQFLKNYTPGIVVKKLSEMLMSLLET